jgi:hypothetical protein
MPSSGKDKLAFSPKDRVNHSVFGSGTIVAINERLTTIDFDGVGTKKFMTNLVKLAPSDTPAPAKPVRKKKKAPAKTA